MSARSSSSLGDASSGEVVRSGYLRKLKTCKKKFFVVRAETPESSARLEYYDSEKKFNSGQQPKRSISLKSCFNINKQVDNKYKHVIALYTKDDRFCIALDSEDDLDTWLKALLSLQQGEDVADGETPRPTFEHVWQVTILKRGLGSSYSKVPETSVYRLCLTDKVLSLIRKDSVEPQIELSLTSIRSCGSLKTYFYLEVGRSSAIGAGELWMETEDANIASNVHQTVYHAMSTNSSSREELGPKSRNRSSSATESSKPVNMVRRQPSAGVPKPIPYTQDAPPITTEMQITTTTTTTHTTTGFAGQRERCDSMPSRARTTSEGNHFLTYFTQRSHLLSHRPQSLYTKDCTPSGSPVSPPSAAGSTDSAGSSLSIDEGEPWPEMEMRYPHSLTPDEPIAEEICEDCLDGPYVNHDNYSSYTPMLPAATTDDGYVQMEPPARSPTASTSSITSGTPSTDMRFAEYPLVKVPSYFTDEETNMVDRPTRAYSIGSRPESCKYRSAYAADAARERAYSVGAKTKKVHNRILPPHGAHAHSGAKSSSAPLLSTSRLQGSHGTIGRDTMADLMEMDFENIKKNPGYMKMSPGPASSGYLKMKPGIGHDLNQNQDKHRNENICRNHDVCRTRQEITRGYDIKRGHDKTKIQNDANTNQSNSSYVDMQLGSSPSKPIGHDTFGIFKSYNKEAFNSVYKALDLKNKFENHAAKPATSPLLPSPLSQTPVQSDYVDMSCNSKNKPKVVKSQPIDVKYSASPVKSSLSPKSFESLPSSIEYIDVDYPPARMTSGAKPSPQTTEGYVEMTLGNQKSNHQRQSSLDSAKVAVSDYTNMSVGSAKKKERKPSKKEKTRSQPIQIQATATPAQMPKASSSNSPVYGSFFSGRKLSTGTSPTMHLPLSTVLYQSLPRQKSRKNSSRRDSKESSSSSVTTPSSSSTIFPISLNSPSSPIKSRAETPGSAKPLPSQAHVDQDDYTIMDFESAKEKRNNDYVNYSPGFQVLKNARTDYSDYAIMKPVTTNKPAKANPSASSSSVLSPLSSMNLNDCSCFRPISESSEANAASQSASPKGCASAENVKPNERLGEPSEAPRDMGDSVAVETSRPGSVVLEPACTSSRPSSTSSELSSTASTIVHSRPSSVNSECVKPTEGQLYYASLDLVRSCEEDGSRSPRTVKAQTSGEGGSGSSQEQPESGFLYAEIDFIKSEGFKHSPLPNNAKVKH